MTILEAFMASIESEAKQRRHSGFLGWLDAYEDVASLTLPELKYAWAEFKEVAWNGEIDYPQPDFWYEGKWRPITRW